MDPYYYYYAGAAGIMFIPIFLFFGARKKKKKSANKNAALFSPKTNFALKLKQLLQSDNQNPQNVIPELEEILLTADVGIKATENLIQSVFTNNPPKNSEELFQNIKTAITEKLTFAANDNAAIQKPKVIYLVGVNGVGKTTTIGKLAKQFKNDGKNVMLVAADTFRAAAVEQLKIWSQKNGVEFAGGKANADPSSVIVDGLQSAVAKKVDVVLVDTAGRLHTKSNLMQELQKMVRMSEKVLQKQPDDIWLVVDAITGQNGFQQAKIFWEAISLTGVILTKYDATAKGGVILSIVEETGLPIRYVGLGEGIDDLKPFNPKDFVGKIFGDTGS